MTTTPERIALDRYVRDNRIALQVWDDDGQRSFNGISKKTLDAFARRGLVWYETHDHGLVKYYTGGLTEKGRSVLALLESEASS